MVDDDTTIRIAELRAQLEALEATLGISNKVSDDSTHKSVVQPPDTSTVKFGGDDPEHVETVKADSATRTETRATSEDQQAIKNSNDRPIPTLPEIIPQLNLVNWTQFKNTILDETKRYAIDVLVGPTKYSRDKRGEESNLQRGVFENSSVPIPTQTAKSHVSGKPEIGSEHADCQFDMPERIRINCSKLLEALSATTDISLGVDKLIILRPYKLLVRYDEVIRQRLKALDEQYSGAHIAPPQHQQVNDDPAAHDLDITATQPFLVNQPIESKEGTKQDRSIILGPSVDDQAQNTETASLRCLVEFMDTYISTAQIRSQVVEKTRFHNLWYAYRPGDLIVTWRDFDEKRGLRFDGFTMESKSSNQISAKGSPSIWRVLSVSKGRSALRPLHALGKSGLPGPLTSETNKFSILCYMLVYNGISYGPLEHTFEISPFEGQRYFKDLDPCPARYVADYSSIEARMIDRGKRFVRYTSPSHCLYDGMTLLNHPCGRPKESFPGIDNIKASLVNGHVIVDFKEARNEDPTWVVSHSLPGPVPDSGDETTEYFSEPTWNEDLKIMWHAPKPGSIFADHHLDAADMEDFVASNRFLSAYKTSFGEDCIDHRAFESIDFALLPDRVVGFDLHRRKFCFLAMDCLKPVQVKKEGWADLKLPRGHKRMVQAQIKTHLLEKRAYENHTSHGTEFDLVRGKGLGLIILLHGAPGVGKTSTAECVAESLRKPLYAITCGDLGVTAPVVENVLNKTFAKAELWDCVLLLDEADVFLAQRTRTDLKRNAIVSVFLRVLEYYKGILILTTNRVGAFDEAFKSRIHLHLYYPALNKAQTRAIWEMNLDRVINRKQGRITADKQEILCFAEGHFERHKRSNTQWNGRQIRNAFQTAVAMAEYEVLEAAGLEEAWDEGAALSNTNAQLHVAHFEIVADASTQFDRYIEETIGSNDAERAFTDRDRADHFRWMVPSNSQAHQYNAQWPHGTQGGSELYGQSRQNPFAPPPEVRVNDFRDTQGTSYQQSQARSSPRATWSGMAPTSRPFVEAAETSYQYPSHEPVAQSGRNVQHNPEGGPPGSSYGHHEDVWPPASLSHRSPPRVPVNMGPTQRQNDDAW